MEDRRLNSWLESTSVLPTEGLVGVFNAWPDMDLPGVAQDRIRAVQPMAAEHEALVARGFDTSKTADGSYAAVILRVPRQKDLALSYLGEAVRRGVVMLLEILQAFATR